MLFDQLDLPFLHLLLTSDRIIDVVEGFIVYEHGAPVFPSTTFNEAVLVLINAPGRIICKTYVECSVPPACHNVNVILSHCASLDPWS